MEYTFRGTKGKWMRDGSTIYATHIVNGGEQNRFYAGFYPDYSGGVTGIEAEYNAQLASCSLEMFEMLKEILEDLKDVDIPTSMADTIDRTHRLLQKATTINY